MWLLANRARMTRHWCGAAHCKFRTFSCALLASGQLLQKVRMPVQKSKKVHNRRQGRRFSTFIPRERVVAATRQFGGHGLAEAELPADPPNLRPLRGTRLQYQLVA